MGERGAELLVDESEGMLLGDRDVVLEVGVDEDVGVRFVVRLGVAKKVPVGFGNGLEAIGTV